MTTLPTGEHHMTVWSRIESPPPFQTHGCTPDLVLLASLSASITGTIDNQSESGSSWSIIPTAFDASDSLRSKSRAAPNYEHLDVPVSFPATANLGKAPSPCLSAFGGCRQTAAYTKIRLSRGHTLMYRPCFIINAMTIAESHVFLAVE